MRTDASMHAEHGAQVVIVAEKEPLNRAALAGLLNYDGYHAIQAEDLSAAIAYIDNAENVIAILVDLDLPGWRAMVRQAAGQQIIVIAMRGRHCISTDELDRRGVSACFDRPITYGDIAYAIRTFAPAMAARAKPEHALVTAKISNLDNIERAKRLN